MNGSGGGIRHAGDSDACLRRVRTKRNKGPRNSPAKAERSGIRRSLIPETECRFKGRP